jgi:branched-chain amino acid transport system substrate-binding protein
MSELRRRRTASLSSQFRRGTELPRGRNRCALALAAGLVLAVSACGGSSGGGGGSSSSSSSGGSFNVAVIADETGIFSVVGGPTVPGAQAAVDSINAAGGIDGHKVKLTVLDSQSTPSGAEVAARHAISGKPTAIIYGALSQELQPSVPLFNQANIPVLSAFTLDSLLFPTPAPWFYTLGSTGGQTARYYLAEAKYLLKGSLKGKRLALEVQGTPQAQAIADALTSLAPSEDADFVVTEHLAVGGTTFASQAQAIESHHPDLVVLIDTATPVIVPALRSAGYKGAMFAGEGASNEATFSQVNDAGYYADRTLKAATAGDTMSLAAQKYGLKITGSYFSSGWTMAYILKTALGKCGYPCSNPSQLESDINSAGNFPIPGGVVFGPVKFSSTRHYGLTKVQFYVWNSAMKSTVTSGPPIDDTDGSPTS